MARENSSETGGEDQLRVLVVDDSEDDALLMVRELQKGGWELVYERVDKAEQMRKALQEKPWDLILCDYKLPSFEAPAAIALAKAIRSDIPIIIISGTIGEEKAVECMRLGAQDYIMKDNFSRLCPVVRRELGEAMVRLHKKKAEEELRQSEQKYRTILENIEEGYYETDLRGNFTFFNDSLCRIIGYPPEETLGLNNRRITDSENAGKLFKTFNEVYKTGLPARAFDWQIIRKDGARRHIEGSVSLLEDLSGQVIGFKGIVRDVTERKEAEKKLRLLTSRLGDIIEFLPDAIYVIDNEKKIIAWNRAIEDMTGVKKSELLDKGNYEYALPLFGRRQPILIDLLDTFNKEILALYQYVEYGEKIYAESYRPSLYGGRGAHLWHVAAPLYDREGNRFGSIEVIRNVTDIKAKEKNLRDSLRRKEIAEAATRAKSEFLATMSHEIRTPMHGIIGLTDLVLQTELTGPQRDYLEKIKMSAHNLMVIINDILDYSKIEAEKMQLETVRFNIRKVISHVFDLTYPDARKKGLELVLHVDEKIPVCIEGDPLRLQQVLMNLASNAVKFTQQGRVVISAERHETAGREENNDTWLKFSVRDTGIGMTEKQTENLFQLFAQADNSVSRKYGGTGLGLAISQRIVQLMGGQISVSSEIGKGSTFVFMIPLREAQEQGITDPWTGEEKDSAGYSAEEEREQWMTRLAGKSVLLVEDNFINQQIAAEILRQAKMHVTVAGSGGEVLEIMAGETFDVILMDVQMPEMDGYQVTRMLRNNEKFKTIPIIAMTAQAMDGDREKCLEAGMNDYVAKPVSASDLYRVLSRWAGSNPR
ncbi:MAG TPA: response regulator [Smithella sp.]|nr:response regulator [Smithella sp.]